MNEHAKEYLELYLKLIDPQYAVLIDGQWGCGKTHFIKDTLKSVGGDYVYISLYGVTSPSEIDDEIFRQLHPVLSSRPMTIGTKVLKGLLRATIKYDHDGDGKDDGAVTASAPDLKRDDLIKILETETRIFVFDDFERCRMDHHVALGYINSLVEHHRYNVMVVCNEAELKKVLDDDGQKYEFVKEKVIGKTMLIVPQVEDALGKFIDEIKSESYKKHLFSRKEIILKTFLSSNYENLRQLRKSLIEYEWFFSLYPERVIQEDQLLDVLLSEYLMLSLEVASGNLNVDSIQDLVRSDVGSDFRLDGALEEYETDSRRVFSEIQEKYSWLDFSQSPMDYSLWGELLSKGLPDRVKVEDCLLSSTYFRQEKTWEKLWYRFHIDDKAFDELILKLEAEFESGAFTDIRDFLHAAGLKINFAHKRLIGGLKKDRTKQLKGYVDWMLEEKHFIPHRERWRDYDSTAEFGKGYSGNDLPEFSELLQYIDTAVDKKRKAEMSSMVSVLLDELENNAENFIHKFMVNSSASENYSEIPILSHMPIVEFADIILRNLENGNTLPAHLLFKERYKYDQYNNHLLSEIDWLNKLEKQLQKGIRKRKGKLSGLKLKDFVEQYLHKAIEQLEAAKANVDARAEAEAKRMQKMNCKGLNTDS